MPNRNCYTNLISDSNNASISSRCANTGKQKKQRPLKQFQKKNKNMAKQYQQSNTAIVPTSVQKMINSLKSNEKENTSYRYGASGMRVQSSRKKQDHVEIENSSKASKLKCISPTLTEYIIRNNTEITNEEEISSLNDTLECNINDHIQAEQNYDTPYDNDVLNEIEELEIKLTAHKIKEDEIKEDTMNEKIILVSKYCNDEGKTIQRTKGESDCCIPNKRRSHPEYALSSSITCLGGQRNNNNDDNKSLKESSYNKGVEYKSQLLMQIEEKRLLQQKEKESKNYSKASKNQHESKDMQITSALNQQQRIDSSQIKINGFESLLCNHREKEREKISPEVSQKGADVVMSSPFEEEEQNESHEFCGWNE